MVVKVRVESVLLIEIFSAEFHNCFWFKVGRIHPQKSARCVRTRVHTHETPLRMGITLSKNHRSNKNIDRAFKNGSSFHPSFEVEDVVTNNGGSMKDSTDSKKSIDNCASFLKKATRSSVSVSEEEVKDVHAEEVLKKHVIDEKNFLGVPTALDENDMDSPLSHYFINSR